MSTCRRDFVPGLRYHGLNQEIETPGLVQKDDVKAVPQFHSCNDLHEAVGAIHLHTTFSDGHTPLADMIAAAGSVGLDYIVVTDHMTLRGLDEGYEGYHGSCAVLVGYEHNDRDNLNHYLALGVQKVVDENLGAREYVAAIQRSGGIGFIAHPSENRHYFKQYPPYPWTAWETSGFNGIELWNQISEWVENLKGWHSFFRIVYPRRFLKGVPQELVRIWDELSSRQFIAGIGGVDAHSYRLRFGPLSVRVFPVKVELKGIRTHLYIDQDLHGMDFGRAKRALLGSLANGHGFISNFRRGDAGGTIFYALDARGTFIAPGKRDLDPESAVSFPVVFHVELPARSEVRKAGRQRGRR